jgi:hypothetical protein
MTQADDSPAAAGDEPAQAPADLAGRWSAWPAVAFERLPLPYALTVTVLALLALGEQLLEYSIERATLGGPPGISPVRLVALPLLVAYILAEVHIVKRAAAKALAELRTSVLVGHEEYERHVRRMLAASPRVELALAVASLVVVLALFVGLSADLLNTNSSLPASLPAAAYIVAMYVLLGWLLLTVAYTSIRHGWALRALAHEPLAINVFDPSGLVPFGRLGLILSLPIAVIVLVPLILLGAPTKAGYVVIALSAVSFSALFVPLWGVHQQMGRAHDRALAAIHQQLQEIHATVLHRPQEAQDLAALNNRAAILVNLRKTIHEAPTWPFKDSGGLVRAVAAVSSPLIYFILNELIRTYLFPILGGGAP